MHVHTATATTATRRVVLTAAVALLGLLALLAGRADATHGAVHPTLLGQGTTADRLVIKTHPHQTSDVRTLRLDFDEAVTTGWHTHPGPGIVTITSGTFLLQRAEQTGCTERALRAGDVFLDDGTPHTLTATSAGSVLVTIVTPEGAPVSSPAPGC